MTLSRDQVLEQHRANVAHVAAELKAARLNYRQLETELARLLSVTNGTEQPQTVIKPFVAAVDRLRRAEQASQ
jgi:hypothetical protein